MAGLMMGHPPPTLQLCSLGLLLVTLPNKWGLGCKGAVVQQSVSPGLARTGQGLVTFSHGQTWAKSHRMRISPPLSIHVLGAPSPPTPKAVADMAEHWEGTQRWCEQPSLTHHR